jgi:hypothetical protein
MAADFLWGGVTDFESFLSFKVTDFARSPLAKSSTWSVFLAIGELLDHAQIPRSFRVPDQPTGA